MRRPILLCPCVETAPLPSRDSELPFLPSLSTNPSDTLPLATHKAGPRNAPNPVPEHPPDGVYFFSWPRRQAVPLIHRMGVDTTFASFLPSAAVAVDHRGRLLSRDSPCVAISSRPRTPKVRVRAPHTVQRFVEVARAGRKFPSCSHKCGWTGCHTRTKVRDVTLPAQPRTTTPPFHSS